MPRNQYVAQFLGEPTINLLECTTEQRLRRTGSLHATQWPSASKARNRLRRRGTFLAIRPHHVRVDHHAGPESGAAKVADIENLGAEHVLHLDYGGQHLAAMAVPGFASVGENVHVTFDLSQAHLIDPANGVRGGFSVEGGRLHDGTFSDRFVKKIWCRPGSERIELSVSKGEFLCLVGPTNAGKSTLLKTIAGLHHPDEGRVMINGQDVTELEPGRRDVSLLFQTVALFPNRSGFDNIAFPLRQAGIREERVEERVREVAELLRISHVLDRFPRTYSGGERQRVAIGRSIAHPSEILLLDEPLSNLDARMRLELRIEFRRLHKTLGQTVIYVTHDQVEALSLADRVAVLHEGRLQQVDSPERLYDLPANRFVAEFIGSPPMNLIPARLGVEDGREMRLTGAGFDLDAPHGVPPETRRKRVVDRCTRGSGAPGRSTDDEKRRSRYESAGLKTTEADRSFMPIWGNDHQGDDSSGPDDGGR